MIRSAAAAAAMESRVRGETFQGHWAQLRGIAAMQGRRCTIQQQYTFVTKYYFLFGVNGPIVGLKPSRTINLFGISIVLSQYFFGRMERTVVVYILHANLPEKSSTARVWLNHVVHVHPNTQ